MGLAIKGGTVFQLMVTLRGVMPLIWRRIQVSSQMTLPQVHRTLQIVMGWQNYHLHEFLSAEKSYAEPDPEDHHFGRDVADERRVRISRLLPEVGASCEYVYDFGDGWHHDIVLEEVLPLTPRKRYPVCLAGARSGPPEDVGGASGYAGYLQALSDMKHRDHKEKLAWRGRFDAEYFSVPSVNRALREAFPAPLKPGQKSARGRQGSSARSLDEENFDLILNTLLRAHCLPQPKRLQIRPDERIPVSFTPRDCEMIREYSFADEELTARLRLTEKSTKPSLFYYTLGELDDLLGFIAAEANHAKKKDQKEWQALFERTIRVLDSYTESD